jgi:ATP-dependent RNA helicase DeaD
VQAPFHKLEIPSGKDVCRKQFYSYIDRILEVDTSHSEYETYMTMLGEKLEHLSKEEILKKVAALEFDRFLKYYENAEDLNVRERKPMQDARGPVGARGQAAGKGEWRDTKGRQGQGSGNYTRLFVNLGTKDGFYKASLLQFILDMSDLRKEVLGRVDLKEMNTWVEIEPSVANTMIKAIDGKRFKGRKIRMNMAD